jgi:hypothetical protein
VGETDAKKQEQEQEQACARAPFCARVKRGEARSLARPAGAGLVRGNTRCRATCLFIIPYLFCDWLVINERIRYSEVRADVGAHYHVNQLATSSLLWRQFHSHSHNFTGNTADKTSNHI